MCVRVCCAHTHGSHQREYGRRRGGVHVWFEQVDVDNALGTITIMIMISIHMRAALCVVHTHYNININVRLVIKIYDACARVLSL